MIIPVLMQVVLAILVFLISLNERMQGSGKSRIRSILFVLHLAIVLAVFAIYRWQWGLISLATVFVCGFVFAPVSSWVAVSILGHRAAPELTEEFSNFFHQRQTPVSDEQLKQLLEEHGLALGDISVWPAIYQEEWNLVMSDPDLLRYFLSLVQDGENQLVIAAKVRQKCLGSGSIG